VTGRAGPITLGSFDFQVTGEAVKTYRHVLGFAEEGEVPVTYATLVLTEPAVLKDLQAILGAQVPVHIAQAFEVMEALKAGQGYKVAMVLEPMRDEHMRLTGTFTDPSGDVCIVMRSEFLLVQSVAPT